jgi:hypothetical protein
VSVVLPWSSLLAAVASPSVAALRGVRGLCQPGAALEVVLGVDPLRDRAELARLGLGAMHVAALEIRLAEGYARAGFALTSVTPVASGELARWPSTWSRRLARGREHLALRIEARADSRA